MAKKGDKYKCPECGVVVVVDEACSCSPCDLVCCDVSMKPVKAPAKAKAKAETKAPAKAVAKEPTKAPAKK